MLLDTTTIFGAVNFKNMIHVWKLTGDVGEVKRWVGEYIAEVFSGMWEG